MRRLLLTLGAAGTCAAALIAGGATAAVPDGSLGARAVVNQAQGVQPAAWVCHWRFGRRHCYQTWGGPYYGPYGYGGPYWGEPGLSFGFGFGGHHWHDWR